LARGACCWGRSRPAQVRALPLAQFVLQGAVLFLRVRRTASTGAGGVLVARVDLSILHEIVRVVQARAKVPERVRIQKREYLITYLEDHRQRIEEALRRHDTDRLGMLFGQLASKVKYQLLRRAASGQRRSVPARAAGRRTTSTRQRKRARAR
jgi:hypothetical protein